MVIEPTPSSLIRWIPAMPLLAACVHGVMLAVVRRPASRNTVLAISCSAAASSFAMSLLGFSDLLGLARGSRGLLDESTSWFGLGAGAQQFGVDIAFRFDALSGSGALMVTGIGLLLHLYAAGAMEDDARLDAGFQRFYCYLNLLLASQLVLVLADDPVLMFMGWQGVTITSALLVAFWYSDAARADAGRTTLVVGLLSDAALLVTIAALFWAYSSVGVVDHGFADIGAQLSLIRERVVSLPFGVEAPLLLGVGACVFFAVCGRSAQGPLYFWLPRSVRAPAPAMAFVMLAAGSGVYLCARLSELLGESGDAAIAMAWLAAVTGLATGVAAVVQRNIYRAVVYVGMSRLACILIATSAGDHRAAISHLSSWAFTQTLLLLTAGVVVHRLDGEQDLKRMGGLREPFVWTHVGMLVAVVSPGALLSLEGLHFSIFTSQLAGAPVLYGIALVSATLVSISLFRVLLLVFWGKRRAPLGFRGDFSDPGLWFMIPVHALVMMATLCIFLNPSQFWGDRVGVEKSDSLSRFLDDGLTPRAVAEMADDQRWQLVGGTVLTLLVGFAVARAVTRRVGRRGKSERSPRAQRAAAAFDRVFPDDAEGRLAERLLTGPLISFARDRLQRGVELPLSDAFWRKGLARAVKGVATYGVRYSQPSLPQVHLLGMLAGILAILWFVLGR